MNQQDALITSLYSQAFEEAVANECTSLCPGIQGSFTKESRRDTFYWYWVGRNNGNVERVYIGPDNPRTKDLIVSLENRKDKAKQAIESMKRMNLAIRSLNINRCTTMTLSMLAARLNPIVREWVTYYGTFYPDTLKRFLIRIDLRLGRWARNKYKRLRGHKRQAWSWLKRCRESLPKLFVHWDFVYSKGDE